MVNGILEEGPFGSFGLFVAGLGDGGLEIDEKDRCVGFGHWCISSDRSGGKYDDGDDSDEYMGDARGEPGV